MCSVFSHLSTFSSFHLLKEPQMLVKGANSEPTSQNPHNCLKWKNNHQRKVCLWYYKYEASGTEKRTDKTG